MLSLMKNDAVHFTYPQNRLTPTSQLKRYEYFRLTSEEIAEVF